MLSLFVSEITSSILLVSCCGISSVSELTMVSEIISSGIGSSFTLRGRFSLATLSSLIGLVVMFYAF